MGTVKVPAALPAAEDCAERVPTKSANIAYGASAEIKVSVRPEVLREQRPGVTLNYISDAHAPPSGQASSRIDPIGNQW